MINPKVQCQPVKEGQNIGTGQNSIKGRWSSPTNTHTQKKEKRYSNNNATTQQKSNKHTPNAPNSPITITADNSHQ